MTRDEHIEKGRASLIPECCILWFVDQDTFDNRTREQHESPCCYVPCPACASAKRFFVIHICDAYRTHDEEPCSECGYIRGAERAFVRQPTAPTPVELLSPHDKQAPLAAALCIWPTHAHGIQNSSRDEQ